MNKILTLRVTNGSLPTSPVLIEHSAPLPVAVQDFEWSYTFRKRVWFVNVVVTFYAAVSEAVEA